MKITVQNTSDLPNKYIRKLKWHLYNLAEKFSHLIYAIVHVKCEGRGTPIYEISVQIGMSGPDVFVKNKSANIDQLMRRCYQDAFRYCRKSKPHD